MYEENIDIEKAKQGLKLLIDAKVFEYFDMIREDFWDKNKISFGYMDCDGCWENEYTIKLEDLPSV